MVMTGVMKQRSYDGDYMATGRKAEEIVMRFLRERPEVVGIEDWRDLRAVQEADVDCAVKMNDGTVTLAEIKSDVHLGVSGNVLFEILRINHTCLPERACTLGWSARSPAMYFIYYAPSVNSIYMCRVDALRRCVQAYTAERRDRTRLHWVNTDNIKSTLNILVPWDACKQVFKVFKLEPEAIPFG
jgi:hypothetical protein